MSVFKACDIRGIAEKDLTDAVATQIAKAVGVKLSGKRIVVGNDVRLSSPRLKEIAVRELAASGCEVVDIGTVATPMFYYAAKHCNATGGVMITASHNPAPYNGFKLLLGDRPIREADILAIKDLYEKKSEIRKNGSIEKFDIIDTYIADMAKKAAPGRLKIVLDAGNGAVSDFAPKFYRACGYEVVELFCTPDGNFPNRPPDPALPENLTLLCEKVKECKADLGIAFDGDGDRAGFVDETGRAVDNDDILVLLARNFLEQEKGTVVYDAKCSMVVPEQIVLAGGAPLMARAGHTFIKEKFLQEKAVFAGELSGHFFFCELGYDDGMFAGTKVCEYVMHHGKLSQLIDAIPNYMLTTEIRIEYLPDNKEEVLAEIAARLKEYQVNLIDGVRVEFSDGWGMIRSSVTQPLFTLRFEAHTQPRLLEIEEVLLKALPLNLREEVREKLLDVNEGK